MEYPQDFQVHAYRFHMKALDNIVLPRYKGSSLRGGFGRSFYKLVCSYPEKKCEQCPIRLRCMYTQVFDTPAQGLIPKRPKYKNAPRPFVLRPPLSTQRIYTAGESLSFRLSLMGYAQQVLPYFIQSFQLLGKTGFGRKKGQYELCSVENIYGENSVSLENPFVFSSRGFTWEDYKKKTGQSIKVTLETPLHLIYKDRPCFKLDFIHLWYSLVRRLRFLSLYYAVPWESTSDLFEEAKEIRATHEGYEWLYWERKPEGKSKIEMGGLLGEIIFTGNLTPFLPLLHLGQYIHLGKATSMGMGSYRIDIIS